MKNNSIHKIIDPLDCFPEEILLLYTENRLTVEEKHRLERHLVDCEMCSDFVEGVSLVKDKREIKTAVSDINEEIRELTSGAKVIRMDVRQISRRRLIRYAAAATLLILIGGGFFLTMEKWKKKNKQIAMNQENGSGDEPATGDTSLLSQQPSPTEPFASVEKHAERNESGNSTGQDLLVSPKKEVLSKKDKGIDSVKEYKPFSGLLVAEAVEERALQVNADEQKPGMTDNVFAGGKEMEKAPEAEPEVTDMESQMALKKARYADAGKAAVMLQAAPATMSREEAAISENTFDVAINKYFEKEFSAALKLFEKVLKEEQDHYEALYYAGECYYHTDRFEQAIKSLEKVLWKEKGKYYEDALWYKSLAHLKKNEKEQAKTLLEKIVSIKGKRKEEAVEKLREMKN